jgi:hypothetical protein
LNSRHRRLQLRSEAAIEKFQASSEHHGLNFCILKMLAFTFLSEEEQLNHLGGLQHLKY